MTAVDNITSLRQRREAIVNQHAEAENRHDIEATIATTSPHGTATRRWPVKCRRGHHGVQTRGAGAADQGTERHARLRATEPVGRYR